MKGTIWCLHGAVGMAADWRGLVVDGWAVKRVDLWRYLDCCEMSLTEFGKALNGEAEALGGRRVLLGYSMGGRLALHALLAGGGWEAGVIVSAHPGLLEESDRLLRRGDDSCWAARALTGDWSDFLEAWEAQGVLAGGDSGIGEDSGGMKMEGRLMLRQRREAVARSFMDWSLGQQQPLWGRLGELDCPLLWWVGERDEKFRALGERVKCECPEVKLCVAPGVGHRVPWELGKEFGEKLGEFLEPLDS